MLSSHAQRLDSEVLDPLPRLPASPPTFARSTGIAGGSASDQVMSRLITHQSRVTRASVRADWHLGTLVVQTCTQACHHHTSHPGGSSDGEWRRMNGWWWRTVVPRNETIEASAGAAVGGHPQTRPFQSWRLGNSSSRSPRTPGLISPRTCGHLPPLGQNRVLGPSARTIKLRPIPPACPNRAVPSRGRVLPASR